MSAAEDVDVYAEIGRCSSWLEAALEHGGKTHTIDDIYKGILERRFQFWPAHDAALVTEVIDYPRERHLHVFLAGGNLETILEMRPSIEAYAKALDCSAMGMCGRAGWARALKDYGYSKSMTTVVKRF